MYSEYGSDLGDYSDHGSDVDMYFNPASDLDMFSDYGSEAGIYDIYGSEGDIDDLYGDDSDGDSNDSSGINGWSADGSFTWDGDTLKEASGPWDEEPFTVEEEGGGQATYTLTLDESFLKALFSASTPIYHSFLGRKIGKEAIPPEAAPVHSVIESVKEVKKSVNDIHTALSNCLRSHPDFGRAKASWQAASPPTAGQEWKTAEELCEHLKGRLFGPVGAILQLLPTAYTLSIVDGDTPTSLSVIATASPSEGKKCKTASATTRVVTVVNIVPCLTHPERKYMKACPDQVPPESLLRLRPEERPFAEANPTTLQRLALRMRASNAPLGVLYNGCELVIVERDFDHDLGRLRQLNLPPRTRSRDARPDLDGSNVCLDLKLAVWSPRYSHPGDTGFYETGLVQPTNPTALLAAIALYSLDRLKARPKALDDVRRYKAISDFLLRNGRCPCRAIVPHGALKAGKDRGAQGQAQTSGVGTSAKPMSARLLFPLESLQRVLPTRADATTSAGDIGEERLVSVGWTPCRGRTSSSNKTSRPSILVASRPIEPFGRFAVEFPASLFVVTGPTELAATHKAIASAITIDPETQDADTSNDVGQGLPVQLDHLYRASSGAVEALLEALSEAYGKSRIFCQEVRLKLPNLQGLAGFSAIGSHPPASSAGHRHDLLCRCPRGLCDAVCAGCVGSTHEYELTAAQRHLKSLTLAFQVEHAAQATLASAWQQSAFGTWMGVRRPSFTALFHVRFALGIGKKALYGPFSLLKPILKGSWPVHLAPGVPFSDVQRYAHAREASHPTTEKLHWSQHRLQACQEIFSYYVEPYLSKRGLWTTNVTLALAEIEQLLDILSKNGLAPRELTAENVFLRCPSEQSLNLFAGASATRDDYIEPTPIITLDLSDCQFVGKCSDLDKVAKHVLEVAYKVKGLPFEADPYGWSEHRPAKLGPVGEGFKDTLKGFQARWMHEGYSSSGSTKASAAPVWVSKNQNPDAHIATVRKFQVWY